MAAMVGKHIAKRCVVSLDGSHISSPTFCLSKLNLSHLSWSCGFSLNSIYIYIHLYLQLCSHIWPVSSLFGSAVQLLCRCGGASTPSYTRSLKSGGMTRAYLGGRSLLTRPVVSANWHPCCSIVFFPSDHVHQNQ